LLDEPLKHPVCVLRGLPSAIHVTETVERQHDYGVCRFGILGKEFL
jgi:hypothetical protein